MIIRVDPYGLEACEACLRALSVRKGEEPSAPWPAWEEYAAILAAHPAPMFASEEEMNASQSPDDPWGDDWPAHDESLLWVPEDGDDVVRIAPTVLVRAGDTLDVVTATKDGVEALLVFRGPDDAGGYQRATGKHAPAEGFERIGMDVTALAALLGKQGISWVAMPEEWTGTGGVDLFAADDFLGILREGSPA